MKNRRFPYWIFVIALILRLIPVLLSYNLPIGLDDMFQYDMLARSIVAGDGFRWYAEDDLDLVERYISMEIPEEYDPRGILTSFRAPGYPTFLALVYGVNGVGPHRFFAARIAQAFLGATVPVTIWILAQQLGFDERVGRWGAGIVAGFPLLVIYPLALATENLFVPLLSLGLVLLLQAGKRGRPVDYALVGVTFGAAALTRSVVAAFLPLALAWLWWRTERGQRTVALRRAALLVACFLVLTVPWAVRNSIIHGKPMWVESALGYDLYVGYHPESSGTFQYGISLDLIPILDDGVRHDKGMEAFWRFVREAPGRIPVLMVNKAGFLWSLDRRALTYFYSNGFLGDLSTRVTILIFTLACLPLVILAPSAAFGLVCGRMDGPTGKDKGLLILLFTYYTGVHMMILAEPRFHVPLLPLVALLAAYAWIERPWRDSRPWQIGVALLLVALLFLNWGLEITRDWDELMALFGPDGHRLHFDY